MSRTIKDNTVSEQRLETVLSGMVAATAVPGAAYDWEQDDRGQGGYRVKFAERPSDQVLARISAQYSVSPGSPRGSASGSQQWLFRKRPIRPAFSAPRTSAMIRRSRANSTNRLAEPSTSSPPTSLAAERISTATWEQLARATRATALPGPCTAASEPGDSLNFASVRKLATTLSAVLSLSMVFVRSAAVSRNRKFAGS